MNLVQVSRKLDLLLPHVVIDIVLGYCDESPLLQAQLVFNREQIFTDSSELTQEYVEEVKQVIKDMTYIQQINWATQVLMNPVICSVYYFLDYFTIDVLTYLLKNHSSDLDYVYMYKFLPRNSEERQLVLNWLDNEQASYWNKIINLQESEQIKWVDKIMSFEMFFERKLFIPLFPLLSKATLEYILAQYKEDLDYNIIENFLYESNISSQNIKVLKKWLLENRAQYVTYVTGLDAEHQKKWLDSIVSDEPARISIGILKGLSDKIKCYAMNKYRDILIDNDYEDIDPIIIN